MGESLLAMYRHQTTCEPPRPSLGRRIDLSEYRDPNFLQNLPQPSSPVSVGQTTVLSSSPSSSLPPVTLPEPAVLPQPGPQPQITPGHATVEVASTTTAPPVGECHTLLCDDEQQFAVGSKTPSCVFTASAMEVSLTDKVKKAPKRKRGVEDSGETAKRRSARVRNTKCKKEEKIDFQELLFKYLPSR